MQEFIIFVGFMVFMSIVLNVTVIYEVKKVKLRTRDRQDIVIMLMLPHIATSFLSILVAGSFLSMAFARYTVMITITIFSLFAILLSVFDNDIARTSKKYIVMVLFSMWVLIMLGFLL